jgi:hypothetical protein
MDMDALIATATKAIKPSKRTKSDKSDRPKAPRWKAPEAIALIEACHLYRLINDMGDEPFNKKAGWQSNVAAVLSLVKWPAGARDDWTVEATVSKIKSLATSWVCHFQKTEDIVYCWNVQLTYVFRSSRTPSEAWMAMFAKS